MEIRQVLTHLPYLGKQKKVLSKLWRAEIMAEKYRRVGVYLVLRGAVRSGSVWAVSCATTSRSTVLSSSEKLLSSLVFLCSKLEQYRPRTKLTPLHIPEGSASRPVSHCTAFYTRCACTAIGYPSAFPCRTSSVALCRY